MHEAVIGLGMPVDTLVDTETHVIAGCYHYDHGQRTGKIVFINKESLSITAEIETAGTLSLAIAHGLLYAANSDGLTVYDRGTLVRELRTDFINTHVTYGTRLIVTDTGGWMSLYDADLQLVERVRISSDALWAAREIAGRIFIGSEEGWAYVYDTTDHTADRSAVRFGSRRSGILDFLLLDDRLLVSSYDGNLECFDLDSLEYRERIEGVGALWKIIREGDAIYAACVYDGVRIFDPDFRLLKHIPTESICYALLLDGPRIFWSSFYENCLFCANIGEE